MAVLEVQIGCYIEVIDSLWPDYIRARLLAEDAAATMQALTGDAATTSQATGDAIHSNQWLEQKTWSMKS
jgi:hypothetical protein